MMNISDILLDDNRWKKLHFHSGRIFFTGKSDQSRI